MPEQDALATPPAPGAAAPAVGGHAWPWAPDQSVAARLAIARNGSLGLETLFATVGALTGFAAQNAVREESLAAGRAETDGLVAVESASGERFYFGDRLNTILVPHRREDLTV